MKILVNSIILLFFLATMSSLYSCETEYENDYEYAPCGYHNGHELFKGPQGGCYYWNDNGNKTYVDRSECDC